MNTEAFLDVMEYTDYISSVFRCHAIAARFLGERNGDSQHVIHAMGHCHIDSGGQACLSVMYGGVAGGGEELSLFID